MCLEHQRARAPKGMDWSRSTCFLVKVFCSTCMDTYFLYICMYNIYFCVCFQAVYISTSDKQSSMQLLSQHVHSKSWRWLRGWANGLLNIETAINLHMCSCWPKPWEFELNTLHVSCCVYHHLDHLRWSQLAWPMMISILHMRLKSKQRLRKSMSRHAAGFLTNSWKVLELLLQRSCKVFDRFLPSSWQCLVSMYVAKHMYGVPCFIFEFLCLYLHCNLILHKSSQLEHVCLCTQKSFANVNCIPGEPNPDTRGANEIWVA